MRQTRYCFDAVERLMFTMLVFQVKCTDEANASALQVARLETENAKLTV